MEIDSEDVIVSLEKLYEKNIEKENVRSAFFNTNYSCLNITDTLKDALKQEKDALFLNIGHDFCIENCPSNQHPHIKILYSFNNPPTVKLTSPKNELLTKEKDIFFQWEGKDNDGKFLEYYVEVYKDGFFEENIVKQTPWSTDNSFSINLESGEYFWRVHARDNSFVSNEVISEVYSFKIEKEDLLKPTILFPEEGFLTNKRSIEFRAIADKDTRNRIFLNDELVADLISSEIVVEIELKKEGENILEIVSKRGQQEEKNSVKIFTKWTPPSTPKFEFKLEEEEVFLRILNDDYEKAQIFLDGQLYKEILKTSEWISLGNKIYGDTNIGVLLEDEVGNKTEIVYKNFLPEDEVLGIGASGQQVPSTLIPNPSLCIYRYNRTHKRFEGRRCNITAPRVLRVENVTRDGKTYIVSIAGVYNPNMIILIDEYECRLPIICAERFVKRTRLNTKPYTAVNTYINESWTSFNERRKIGPHLFMFRIVKNYNPTGNRVNLKYHTHQGFRHDGNWINLNLESGFSNTRVIPPALRIPTKNPRAIFRFPFSRNIGVTQWHGYTAFQSPHTGIDFGSYREPVYAIGDGIIRDAKWDNYSGSCLSGGYFVRVEHNNGMNSVYLHLENYRKSNGQNWRVGQRVKKGELIGRSGNTGAYNCQPLGYHLHFELRRGFSQNTHMNPVPYINVNWDNIHTLNHTRYPGRLTGNNPHPTW